MNVVIVSTAYPLRGGIAHYNALLAKHLGVRHHVQTITFKRQYPSFLFPGKSQEESGVPSNELEVAPAPQWVDSINPFNWISVAGRIAALKPDLLIFKYWLPFFGPCFGTIAKLVKKKTGSKVLFICDNILPHERRPGDVAFTRYAFKQCDCFIVQSDVIEKELTAFWPGAHYVKAPHPVYEIFGSAMPKAEAKTALHIDAPRVILFFGYVRKYKGLAMLLEAMNELRTRHAELAKGLLLIVAGEFYDDERAYRKLAADLHLEESVRFDSDYISNDKVGAYFSAADVVVLPYTSATQSGITQIAYNFGKPVIATSVGGLAEVVLDEKTGFIVPPADPSALAGAIEKFYRLNKEAEFSANASEEKKRYTWDAFISAIEEGVRTVHRAA
jgi:glycosyltransferase involved in cell wall biosynthesis